VLRRWRRERVNTEERSNEDERRDESKDPSSDRAVGVDGVVAGAVFNGYLSTPWSPVPPSLRVNRDLRPPSVSSAPSVI